MRHLHEAPPVAPEAAEAVAASGVARFELRPVDGSAGYRCWTLDQVWAVYVRDDGQVTIKAGDFSGDVADLQRLIDMLHEAADTYAAGTDHEDGARWPR